VSPLIRQSHTPIAKSREPRSEIAQPFQGAIRAGAKPRLAALDCSWRPVHRGALVHYRASFDGGIVNGSWVPNPRSMRLRIGKEWPLFRAGLGSRWRPAPNIRAPRAPVILAMRVRVPGGNNAKTPARAASLRDALLKLRSHRPCESHDARCPCALATARDEMLSQTRPE
jgi:hypothetical protein